MVWGTEGGAVVMMMRMGLGYEAEPLHPQPSLAPNLRSLRLPFEENQNHDKLPTPSDV